MDPESVPPAEVDDGAHYLPPLQQPQDVPNEEFTMFMWDKKWQNSDLVWYNDLEAVVPANITIKISLLTLFKLFLTDSILDTIIYNTNAYALRKMATRQDTYGLWLLITRNEL